MVTVINRLPNWIQMILVTVIILGIIFGISYIFTVEPCLDLKPCKHLTERQVILKHEKYVMFYDQFSTTTNEKKKERLLDSLIKYRIN